MSLLDQTPIVGGIARQVANATPQGIQGLNPSPGQSLLSQTHIERDPFDVTVGAALYGGADVLGLGARAIGAITPGEGESNPFTSFGNSVHQWQQEHPNYAPEEVESAWDLLKNPGALVSRISSGIPYLIGTAALIATGPVGLATATGLSFAVEARRGFESGKADGLDDETATKKGLIQGTISSMLQIIPVQRLFRAGHGVETSLIAALTDKAVRATKGLGVATREAAQFVAMQTVLGTLGGSVDDLVSRGLYGKPLPKDMLDKILQNAITALPNAELGGLAFKKLLGSPSDEIAKKMKDATGDAFSYDDLRTIAMRDFKYDSKTTENVLAISRSLTSEYARRNKISESEALGRLFAKDPGGDLAGQVLSQDYQNVKGFFSKAKETIDGLMQEKWSTSDLLPYLKKSIKDEELEWTGLGGLLKSKKTVTKEEMQSWLNEHEVKIISKVRGEEVGQDYKEEIGKLHNERIELQNELLKYTPLNPSHIKNRSPEEQAKVAQLNEALQKNRDAQVVLRQNLDDSATQYSSYTLPGGSNYREILLRFPSEDYSFSMNPHWEEPDVIAHLRVTDRNVGGKKVLMLEEIQSDWHQQGREEGYNSNESRAERDQLQTQLTEVVKKIDSLESLEKDSRKAALEAPSGKGKELTSIYYKHRDELHALKQKRSQLNQKLDKRYNEVSPAPFKDSWPDLALKKALLLAVEEGHDSIAWTTGEQQVERYGSMLTEKQRNGLRKFYDEILPQKIKDLVKRYDKDVKVRGEQIDVPTEHKGPSTRLYEEHYSGGMKKENVLAITLSDTLKRRIAQEGLPLFQGDASGAPHSRPLPQNKLLKAIVTDDGHVHIMDSEDHARIVKALGLDPKKMSATGLAQLIDDGTVMFHGFKEGVGQYDPEFFKRGGSETKGPVSLMEIPQGKYTYYGKAKQGLSDRLGLELFQSNRASVTFLKTGQAVIRALQNPDASSMLHEIFHVFRRTLEGEDLKTLEKWVGTKDGVWEIEHEEKAAKGWERYLREGKAPSPELKTVFDYLKDIFKSIYQSVKALGRDSVINDEIRGVFDRMLYEDSSPVTSKRLALREAETRLAFAKAGLDESGKPLPSSKSEPEIFKAQKGIATKTAEALVKSAREELDAAKAQNFKPGVPSEVQRLEDFRSRMPVDVTPPDRGVFKRAFHDVTSNLKTWFFSMASPLYETKGGSLAMEKVIDAFVSSNIMKGRFEDEKVATWRGLSNQEARDLASDPEKSGVSNGRKIVEPGSVPDELVKEGPLTEGLSGYQNFMGKVSRFFGLKGEELNVLRRMRRGVEPSRTSQETKLPRLLTPEGFQLIESQAGEGFQSLVKWIEKHNPGLDFDKIRNTLNELYGPEARTKRILGAVEEARTIKFVPDYVYLKDGSKIQFLHTNPFDVMTRTINRQSERLAFIEQFGQNLLSNVKNSILLKLLNILGKNKDFEEVLSSKVDRTSKGKLTDTRAASAIENDLWEKIQEVGISKSDNLKLAKQIGVPTKLTREELLDVFKSYNANNITKAQGKALTRLARETEGITTTQTTPQKVLYDLIKRAETDIPDYLVDQLRSLHVREGGNARSFDEAIALAQGVPLWELGTGVIARSTRFISNLIGGFQTSGAVAPNIPQPLVQIPQLAGVLNLAKAYQAVLSNPEMTRAQIVALGAMPRAINIWSFEPGRTIESFGRMITQAISTGTLQKKMSEMNNVVAGEAFRQFAEQLRPGTQKSGDLRALKFLDLTSAEIKEVSGGKMSERTYQKIVQRGVAKTQFVTESPVMGAKLQNIPLARMLFSYTNYAFGTIRANIDVASNLAEAIKSGKAENILPAMRRSTVFLAGVLGAGAVSQILRQAIKGDFRKTRAAEDVGDLAKGAFAEAGLFGPMHRLNDAFTYDGGTTEKALIGFMPQIAALVDVFNAAVGRGKFGQFGPGKRFKEEALNNAPLAKGFRNWLDANAYPDLVKYKETREASSNWRRENGTTEDKRSLTTEAQLNPDYFPVFEAIQRDDPELAREAMKDFIKNEIKEGRGAKLSERMDALKASLVSRSPIPLSMTNTGKGSQVPPMLRFLASLPQEKRQRFVQEHGRYMRLVNMIVP